MAPNPPPTDHSSTRDGTPPRARIVDRVLRLALGLASGAGMVWGIWRIGEGDRGAAIAGMVAGVATIAAWLLCESPDDPGRGWLGRVAVPGPVRVLAELTLIGAAAAAIWLGGSRAASETLLTVAGLHLVLSWDRVAWLLGWRRGAAHARGSPDDTR